MVYSSIVNNCIDCSAIVNDYHFKRQGFLTMHLGHPQECKIKIYLNVHVPCAVCPLL